METEILGGDLAVVKEVDPNTINENDIIAFRDGDIDIMHRVVDIVEEDGVRKHKTKGNSNNMEDVTFTSNVRFKEKI